MFVRKQLPAQGLSRWVHSFRQYVFAENESPMLQHFPGTSAELFIHGAHALSTGGLVCLRSKMFSQPINTRCVFSIRLRAGALPFVSTQPVAQLIDCYTPLKQIVWAGQTLEALSSQISHSPYFEEQCGLAERFLASCVRQVPLLANMQSMTTAMYERAADFSLGEYAETHGINRSTLYRQFCKTQGVTPKHFHTLCRFERFLRDALYEEADSLASLSAAHGYCDQAHMNHCVTELTRLTPSRLRGMHSLKVLYDSRSSCSET